MAAKDDIAEASSKVTNTVSDGIGKIAKLPLSAKFWAIAGITIVASAAVAPAAVAATITTLPPVTSFGVAAANTGTVVGSSLYNGVPIMAEGAWGLIPTGAETAGAGADVVQKTVETTAGAMVEETAATGLGNAAPAFVPPGG